MESVLSHFENLVLESQHLRNQQIRQLTLEQFKMISSLFNQKFDMFNLYTSVFLHLEIIALKTLAKTHHLCLSQSHVPLWTHMDRKLHY